MHKLDYPKIDPISARVTNKNTRCRVLVVNVLKIEFALKSQFRINEPFASGSGFVMCKIYWWSYDE